MTERKTGATAEIPEFVLLAAEALRSAALKEAQAIAPYGYAVVSVADLRALVDAWKSDGRLPQATFDRIAALIGDGA